MTTPTDPLSFVQPFWWSHTIQGESILPLANNDQLASEGGKAVLAFVPEQTPTLSSCTGEQDYEEGCDFQWKPGSREIYIPADSRITVRTEEDIYCPANSQPHGGCRDRDNDIFFGPKDEYHNLQSAVTYRFNPASENWTAPAGLTPQGTLPRLAKQLKTNEPITVVLLGDSISQGANASGSYNVPPNMPPYGTLLCNAMGQRFDRPINLINLSVGGKTSVWGLEQVDEVIKHQPDLVILAFGMNDASAKRTPKEFQETTQSIITAIKTDTPTTEFILVASMTANSQWVHSNPPMYQQYRDVLKELQAQGIALADVYCLWEEMVQRKSFLALTGNGLNHPNDFGHRLYAQVLWATLLHAAGQPRNCR